MNGSVLTEEEADQIIQQIAHTQECPKCRGLVVTEPVTEALEEVGEYAGGVSQIFRCVICGELLDKDILMNRSHSLAALAS